MLHLSFFYIEKNVFCYSLLSLQTLVLYLYSLKVILLCFFLSFPSLSFTSLFIQNKCCTLCFQLRSINLQLIGLLKITTITPELPLAAFVSSGAEFIEPPCPERTKQCKLRYLFFCYFCFLVPVPMSLPAFLPHSVSSPLLEKEAKY